MKPFQIVWELFVFGLQAAFLYGLALIAAIALIAYAIVDGQQPKEQIKYVEIRTNSKTITEKECIRPAGCRVLEDGTVEY